MWLVAGLGWSFISDYSPERESVRTRLRRGRGITAATARTHRPTHFVPHSANMIDGNGMHAYRVLSAAGHRRIFNYR